MIGARGKTLPAALVFTMGIAYYSPAPRSGGVALHRPIDSAQTVTAPARCAMTLLYCSPHFLDHETGDHPECADRIRRIPEHLQQAGLLAQCRQPEFQPVSRPQLAAVHSLTYVDEVWAYAESGGGTSRPTPLSARPATTWP